MANDKKQVEAITPINEDFARWYTDIVINAELVDYSSVKGCVILRPYGYAIWENVQKILDGMFKETGHENVYMPMFIPEGLLQKEKDHVVGFAPEVAWVTHGGAEELQERDLRDRRMRGLRHVVTIEASRAVAGTGARARYTLNRKCMTSPARSTYSLPTSRIFPASFAPCSPPSAMKSS